MTIRVITEDSASGAQVIDGSLRFDETKGFYLTRTPTSNGNRRTWTWSCWCKIAKLPASGTNGDRALFSAVDAQTNGDDDSIRFLRTGATGANSLYWSSSEYNVGAEEVIYTNAVLRDPNAFYHVVLTKDTTQSSLANGQMRMYINGVEQSLVESNAISQNAERAINSQVPHAIGDHYDQDRQWDGLMSQVYFIDGQALGPGYFGYTDPLTNTWRPKKFRAEGTTVNDGTTWSSGIPGNTLSGYPATNGFDGNLSNYVYADNGTTMTWTAPKKITGQKIEVYVYAGNTHPVLEVNGLNTGNAVGGAAQQNVWVDVTDLCGGPGGRLETITAYGQNIGGINRSSGFAAVRVDGVIMVDSTTQNLAFGTNGFYLPMDGSAPIGQDQSGRGNNWTPVNFGGSAALDKATGALPILNTVSGGRVATVGVRTDSDSSSLVLALPLVGSATDVSNQINSGSTTKTVTAVGNASASSVQSNFYGGSFVFDGSGDALKSTSSGLAPGTSDFCCEGWFYYNAQPSTSAYRLLGNVNSVANTTDWQLIHQTNGNLTLWSGSGYTSIGTSPIPTASWTHIAYVRDGATHKAYINGVQMGSTVTRTGHNLTYNGLDIGGRDDGAEPVNGYIQDVRFYIGTPKYTSNFIPASTNPDILPDTPSGVAGGSALTKVTDGAIDLRSTGYIDVSSSADFSFGTNPFTVEYYIYVKSATDFVGLPECRPSSTNGNYFLIVMFATRRLAIYKSSTASSDFFIPASADTEVPAYRWTHVAYVREGTGSNQAKLYFDGKLVGQGTDDANYTTQRVNFGDHAFLDGNFDGLISNIRIVKGSAVYNSEFTPPTSSLTNITNTVLLCGQSQTSVTAATVSPSTPTSATAVATNFNPFNTDINAVRGQESGYCTWNPLAVQLSGHGGFRDGNLEIIADTAGSHKGTLATFAIPSTGKWYWEVKAYRTGATNNGGGAIGVAEASAISATAASGTRLGETSSSSWVVSLTDFDARHAGNSDYADYLNGGTVENDTKIIGIAVDMDNDKMWMHYDGVYGNAGGTGNPVTGANPAFSGEFSGLEIFPAAGVTVDSGSGFLRANWGQKPFSFPPPAGFQPLNAANVRPSTVIARPDQYVGVTTYTGNDTGQSIGGLSFSPDFVWIKDRSGTNNHMLFDTVRGTNGKNLISNSTAIEGAAGSDDLTAFNSDGFTLGANNAVNDLNVNFVAWTWKAGGNKNTFNIDDVGYASASAAGLDGGTITPTGASVNTKSGFSIITYTGNETQGDTVAHGLGKNPAFIIIKRRTGGTSSWLVGHQSLATNWGQVLYLDLPDGQFDQTAPFNDTAPTSSVWTMWDSSSNNASGSTYVAYLWAEIPGFSKFGSYTGNGTTDGPFQECGFRPRWIMIKSYVNGSTANGNDWTIFDTTRSTYNETAAFLEANTSNQEYTGGNDQIDILSNGFKPRQGNTQTNHQSNSYIYAAFAEAPTFNLYGAQANAR